MIVDSSALIAIVFKEPGFEALLESLSGAEQPGISTPTLVEAGIVLSARLARDARPLLYRLVTLSQKVTVIGPLTDSTGLTDLTGCRGQFSAHTHVTADRLASALAGWLTSVPGKPV